MERTASGSSPGEVYVAAVAAETFAALYLDRVVRFATMVSPPNADPDDVAQEAIVTALERLDRYDPGRGSMDGWLWRIVVNRARDAGRVTRRSELLLERLLATGDRTPRIEASAEAVVMDRLRDQDLLTAVRRLPSRYRTVVALRYGACLSSPEIADLLGTTRMAIVKTLHRALNRLRNDLEV